MVEEFWKSLTGAFEERWLINVFGPALVFWGAGLWAWAQLRGLDAVLFVWQGYALEVKIFLGAAGLLLVFFTAILLESFSGPILRFYEGYWPRWPRLAQRRAEQLARKQERQRVLRTQVIRGQATTADRAELLQLNAELAQRPQDPEQSMPTKLGDILRSAEEDARQRYGLDPATFWPRLYPELSDALRRSLETTQDQLNLALRLATLAAISAVLWTVVVLIQGQWGVLWWTLPALPLAWLLWRSASQPATNYAALLRSAFDLHRFDVYKRMHWPPPASTESEPAAGQALVLYLVSGTVAEPVLYTEDDE
jgi:hypothetical protein